MNRVFGSLTGVSIGWFHALLRFDAAVDTSISIGGPDMQLITGYFLMTFRYASACSSVALRLALESAVSMGS